MDQFDSSAVFNDDFSYFYADRMNESRTTGDISAIDRLVGNVASMTILDLCCGEGRIATELASKGARVVGVDRTTSYVSLADTARRKSKTNAHYVAANMLSLPLRSAFNLVICWYTSFGYFDDETNRQALRMMRSVLLCGGQLVLDLDAKEHLLRSGLPLQVRERGDDIMVEQFRFDPPTSRVRVMRTVVRDDDVRRCTYFVRVFDEDEIREWLIDAGFDAVEVFNEQGTRFTAGNRRMVIRAQSLE